MRAIDIGRTHVITASPQTPVGDIAQIMLTHQVSCITVVDAHDLPLGVICEHDLISHSLLGDAHARRLTAIDIMSKPAVVCHVDASLAEIVQAMENGSIAHLPLVDENHRLAGIVSATDVTAAMAELLARLARALAPDALSDRPYA
ncbi:CBS domain-containing protein [Luteibacter sp. UNCMF331Sha3.1]|uniref:CBS domain-containing protein n=1 Tax=Luteibacter sp. UNCMF331Sha3.1 TaxID=1502760 RepID=UPI0008C46A37|nr:CBS domain-containing protein [Luteibacter sp. UNCMF331Sha3.1]SEN19048.1 CBS domain-containing protein [Luteibacter sp. UNCMF331Sha3.1]